MPFQASTRYRTSIRVSFEDDEQRQKPDECWSLWSKCRGQQDAHCRGGKLQAVEYVEPGRLIGGEDSRAVVQLETSSFDRFSVTWVSGSSEAPEVNVGVRFNFVSTDFSYSKGVKGVPVRLCAKTRILAPDSATSGLEYSKPEICYCKVKLFRDHGAERKLSNDVAHVKKTVDKLKLQIALAESERNDTERRKRTSAKLKVGNPQSASKAAKHKHTRCIPLANPADGPGAGTERPTLQNDLCLKLQTFQDMFSSSRPVSVLYLQGEELDDPDLHPVSIARVALSPTDAYGARAGQSCQVRNGKSPNANSMVSRCPSSSSRAPRPSALAQGAKGPKAQGALIDDAAGKALGRLTTLKRIEGQGGLGGEVEALGIDPSHRSPAERKPKPIACFYLLRPITTHPQKREYYRAVYLTERSLKDFNQKVAAKFGLDAAKIGRTLHRAHNGLEVEIDDDVMREMKEGQDMKLEVETVEESMRQERGVAVGGSSSMEGACQLSNDHHILRVSF